MQRKYLNPDVFTEYYEISIGNTNIILLIFYNITTILIDSK